MELASYVLSLILAAFPPGKSTNSLEMLPSCGDDPTWCRSAPGPACPREHASCANPERNGLCCSPPRFVKGLGWTRIEGREAGTRRLWVVARALADAVTEEGKFWPERVVLRATEDDLRRDLARTLVAALGYSTGFREDIQVSRVRGPGGEACLADMRIQTFRLFLDPEHRQKSEDEIVKLVSGLDYSSLRICLGAAARNMVEARRVASFACRERDRPKLLSALALYGTGRYCRTAEAVGPNLIALEKYREVVVGLEAKKYAMILRFRAMGKSPAFPKWFDRRWASP